MVSSNKYLLILLSLVCVAIPSVGGMKYDISITDDSRELIEFVRFGFQSGFFRMSVSDLKVAKKDWVPNLPNLYKLGFLLHYSEYDTDYLPLGKSLCSPASSRTLQRYLLTLRNGTTTAEAKINDGFYTLYFVNCVDRPASFKLHLEEVNMESNEICYLTSGLCDMNLMYGILIVPYALMVLFWFHTIISRTHPRKLYQTLMLPICISKLVGCILGVAIYQDFRDHGKPITGLSIAFYIHRALHEIVAFAYFMYLVSGSMLKVRRYGRRELALSSSMSLLVFLSALAECVYTLSLPGSTTLFSWKVAFWAFRFGAIALLGIQSFLAFRIVHLAQHLRTHIQARLLVWLLLALGFYFVVADLLATVVMETGLQAKATWVGFFLQEVSELCMWLAFGYTIRSAIMVLEPELGISRLFI